MASLDGLMIWVPDVVASVEFYEQAFGLPRGWVRAEGDYAQMSTGATMLQFATEAAAPTSGVQIAPHRPDRPAAAMQLALGVEDVAVAYDRAVSAGAVAVADPVTKPWGQVVAYVRDPDGVLVELSTPGG